MKKATDDNFISASEIAEYVYCERAWWYRRRGFESSQQAVMDAGTEQHERLGRQIRETVSVRLWAWRLVLLGVVLLLILLALKLITGVA